MREIFYKEEWDVLGHAAGIMFISETDRENRTEFELSGLIAEELEMMGGKERRAVMREAGLNPDEYDF